MSDKSLLPQASLLPPEALVVSHEHRRIASLEGSFLRGSPPTMPDAPRAWTRLAPGGGRSDPDPAASTAVTRMAQTAAESSGRMWQRWEHRLLVSPDVYVEIRKRGPGMILTRSRDSSKGGPSWAPPAWTATCILNHASS